MKGSAQLRQVVAPPRRAQGRLTRCSSGEISLPLFKIVVTKSLLAEKLDLVVWGLTDSQCQSGIYICQHYQTALRNYPYCLRRYLDLYWTSFSLRNYRAGYE